MKLALKRALAAIILVLSLAAPVAAGPFEDATAAYSRGRLLCGFCARQPGASIQVFGSICQSGNSNCPDACTVVLGSSHRVANDTSFPENQA